MLKRNGSTKVQPSAHEASLLWGDLRAAGARIVQAARTLTDESNANGALAGAAEFAPDCESAESQKHEAAWFGRGSCASDVAVLGVHGNGIRSVINKCDAGCREVSLNIGNVLRGVKVARAGRTRGAWKTRHVRRRAVLSHVARYAETAAHKYACGQAWVQEVEGQAGVRGKLDDVERPEGGPARLKKTKEGAIVGVAADGEGGQSKPFAVVGTNVIQEILNIGLASCQPGIVAVSGASADGDLIRSAGCHHH